MSAPTLMPTLAPTLIPTSAPTLMPTSAPTLMPTPPTVSRIQQEGNAMADIATAIPGLTTLSGMDRYVLRAYLTCDFSLHYTKPQTL